MFNWNFTRLLPDCMYFLNEHESSSGSEMKQVKPALHTMQDCTTSYVGDLVTWKLFKASNNQHQLLILSCGRSGDLDYWCDRYHDAWYKHLSDEYHLVIYSYPESCDSSRAAHALEIIVNSYIDKGYSQSEMCLYGVMTGCSVVLRYVCMLVNPSFSKIVLESPFTSFKDMLLWKNPSWKPFEKVVYIPDEVNCVDLSKWVIDHYNRGRDLLDIVIIINSMNSEIPVDFSRALEKDYLVQIEEYSIEWAKGITS